MMILDLGIIDYAESLRIQHELVNKRRLGEISDSVMIVEHPPVFTIGKSGSKKNLLIKEDDPALNGIKVIEVDRGGDITFHSPGQLVIYPVIDLKQRIKDLHRYLKDLEDVAINFLRRYRVEGIRADGATGVWIRDKKIASIGIMAKDWVTCHGLSINVNNDTSFFSMINPCGIKGLQMISLKDILGREVHLSSAKRVLLDEFARIFGIDEARTGHELHWAVA